MASDLKGDGLKVPDKVLRFTSFATALAQADSANEMAQVFQDYAGGVGGYSGKRRAKGTYVTLNAYLGAAQSSERAGGGRGTARGVHAPVGLEFGGAGGGWSYGLMMQLIDIGVLASYRIDAAEDGLNSEPEVGFAQVLSPGLVVVLGFPKFPLSVGGGVSYAPELRSYVDGVTPNLGVTRWSILVAVDVPVLRIR
jgi:hypothetical protein